MNGEQGRELLLPMVPSISGLPNNVQTTLPESVRSAVFVSITALFMANAAIENRAIELRWFDKGGQLKGIAEAIDLQAPSTNVEYVWGLTGAAYVGGLTLTQHIPFAMVAQGGDVLQIRDINDASATDAFVNAVAYFRDVVEIVQRGGG